jgi:hypothetical protein
MCWTPQYLVYFREWVCVGVWELLEAINKPYVTYGKLNELTHCSWVFGISTATAGRQHLPSGTTNLQLSF